METRGNRTDLRQTKTPSMPSKWSSLAFYYYYYYFSSLLRWRTGYGMMMKLLCGRGSFVFVKYLLWSPLMTWNGGIKKLGEGAVSRRKLLNLLLLAFIFYDASLGIFISFFAFRRGLYRVTRERLWGKQLCAWLYDDIRAASHPLRDFSMSFANSIHQTEVETRLPKKVRIIFQNFLDFWVNSLMFLVSDST